MTVNTLSREQEILAQFNISSTHAGACFAPNQWSSEQNSGTITSVNPTTGEAIAQVYNCSAQDYQRVIDAAQEAFLIWRQVPAPKRGDLIRQIGQRLRENKSALGSLVALEMGKSKQEGDGEVQEMIDMADLAVGQSRMLYGNTMHSERPQHRMYEQWHPLGIVGVISAFNFPVAVWAWNAFIAAICGNTVVWKPSPKTPLCTIAVQRICNQVLQENNYPAVFTCFISSEVERTIECVQDPRLGLISFTGSSAVGAQISPYVAARMGRCLLECSGNNALIVDETADLSLAIPAIVFGAIGTAGQRCTSTRRLFVHESMKERLVAALVKAFKSIKIGDPLDLENHMGPLIDQQAVDHYVAAIQAAKEQGGKVLWGDQVLQQPGFFVQPTLIEAENHWPIVQQETFAPILYIMSFNQLDQAIAAQNNVSQGLSSALFTQNIHAAEQFLAAQGSDCGIANINIGTSGAEIGGAFGGEKATGGGREAGSDSWKAYMRRQTNTINWSHDLPLAQGIEFNLD